MTKQQTLLMASSNEQIPFLAQSLTVSGVPELFYSS